jgi:SAM-dependent methyltransferase
MTERMYAELADWWTLLSPVDEYAEEAAIYRRALHEHAPSPPRTLLELGSGGGNNAFHLKADFELTLVDLSEDMLRQSRKTNPELPHQLGDMRDVRLGRVFDAVFIHDAIAYMTTRRDLARALETAYVHCRAGGVAVFAPDETRERFVPSVSSGGTDEGVRGSRYLEWSHDPDPDDETAVTDYAFLVREANSEVRVVHDRHLHGLFPHQVWLDTLVAVGFEPRSQIYEHPDVENGLELFIGLKR